MWQDRTTAFLAKAGPDEGAWRDRDGNRWSCHRRPAHPRRSAGAHRLARRGLRRWRQRARPRPRGAARARDRGAARVAGEGDEALDEPSTRRWTTRTIRPRMRTERCVRPRPSSCAAPHHRRFDGGEPQATAPGRARGSDRGDRLRPRRVAGRRQRCALCSNLRGRIVLPGLIDAHIHWGTYAVARRNLQIGADDTLPDVLRRVRQQAAEAPPGQWIIGQGWDHQACGPLARTARIWTPSPARIESALTRRMAAIWLAERRGAGGVRHRRGDGRPGRRRDSAQRRPADRHPGRDRAAARARRGAAPRHVRAPGGDDRGVARRVVPRPHRHARHGLPAPVPLPRPGDAAMPESWASSSYGTCPSELDEAIGLGLRSGLGDGWLRVGGLKLFLDGTLGSQAAHAALRTRSADNVGLPTLGRPSSRTSSAARPTPGWPPPCAIGDAQTASPGRLRGGERRLCPPRRCGSASSTCRSSTPPMSNRFRAHGVGEESHAADPLRDDHDGRRSSLGIARRRQRPGARSYGFLGRALAFGSDAFDEDARRLRHPRGRRHPPGADPANRAAAGAGAAAIGARGAARLHRRRRALPGWRTRSRSLCVGSQAWATSSSSIGIR
ncbi:MAG: amidohydrolase family protein [Anaerolineae bacterium]